MPHALSRLSETSAFRTGLTQAFPQGGCMAMLAGSRCEEKRLNTLKQQHIERKAKDRQDKLPNFPWIPESQPSNIR
jgi:hypothetical protein